MTFMVRAATPALAPYVDRLGYYEAHDVSGRELVLPTGTMALIVNLAGDEARWYDGDRFATVHTGGGAVLLGASVRRISAAVADWHTGAFLSFRPGGAYSFLGPPPSAIDEPVAELEWLWGRSGAVLREQLLEAPTPHAALVTLETALLDHVTRPFQPDRAVAFAASALSRGATVAAVADWLGLTQRTLRRRFTDRVGLSPKRFARVRRLRRLLASIPAEGVVDWAQAAVVCGYFDQSHMINDFQELAGITPSAYRPRSFICRNHNPGTAVAVLQ